MKILIVSFALFVAAAAGARADLILGTSNPPGTPLTMSAGTTSGPMLINLVSDDAPHDVLAAWNFQLQMLPDAGATGTLVFEDPTTGAASNPPGYLFGADGLGIVANNSGNLLDANDFFSPVAAPGMPVPGAPGTNLLQVVFSASPDAAGLFGIYAVQGAALTQWTDSEFNTRLFSNVPDGAGIVRIGEVQILQAVPEPLSIILLGLGGVISIGVRCRRRSSSVRPNESARRG